MRKKSVYFIISILILSLLPQPFIHIANANNFHVKAEILNVRSGPGLSYDVIDTLTNDEEFNILSTSSDWLQIQYGEKTGWVAAWLTTYSHQSTNVSTNKEIISQVNALNLRANPSIDAPILNRLNAGDRATVLNREGEWIQVTFNGTDGWVYAQYTTGVSSEATSDSANEKTYDEINDRIFTVAVNALNVRNQPGLSSKKIDVIYKNEHYQVIDIDGNWIQIVLKNNKKGWVYSFHGTLNETQTISSSNSIQSNNSAQVATILTNGTNIRQAASTSSAIVARANAGEQFPIIQEHGDWYEISLNDQSTAFIASWVVSLAGQTTTATEKPKSRTPGTLNGLTIVLDPGHGGNDRGTTSVSGIDEKIITLKTAELLASKLRSAGATVHLTRETDRYISLQDRVWANLQTNADAFISLHYDANLDSSIHGFTTYYQFNNQRSLAQHVNDSLASTISLRNRGVQPTDFYVLRNNKENAILLELGFLTNPNEELTITSQNFRDQATYGIYKGILNFFNE